MNIPRPPICTIIAGPNGAGKSTIFSLIELPGEFINADDIARRLNPENPDQASFQAGREAIRVLDEKLLDRSDFCYETTLSSRQSLKVIQQAHLAGYRTQLIFVALPHVELHIQRVKDRVMKGGHDIPEDTIRRRYDVAFENLALAIPLSDEIAIFGNSDKSGPAVKVEIREGLIERSSLQANNPFDRRIAISVAAGLAIPIESLFPDAG